MSVRREPLADGVRYASDSAQITLTAPMAHVILVRFTGDVTEDLARELRAELPAFAKQHAPSELFVDQLEAGEVPTSFRRDMLGILSKMKSEVTKVHVVSGRTLMSMLVATANIILNNRLRSYSDRKQFEHEMRRVSAAPSG